MSGDPGQVKKFRRKVKAKGTELSFEKLVPMPKELQDKSSPPKIVSDKEYPKALAEATEGEHYVTVGGPISDAMSKDYKSRFGADNWYDWCVKHWGTKWDVDAEVDAEGAGYIEYHFDSAWAPPLEWLEKVAKQYPSLQFTLSYEEPGMGFAGEIAFEKGVEKYHDERVMEEEEET